MRSIFIFTIISFLVAACAAPTVTMTIPATITSTATPSFTATPTHSPVQVEQMKAINELIKSWGMDASKSNYSYNTETGDLGIYLAKNSFLSLAGEVKLTLADGSIADLKSSAVTFDEQGELKIAGYKIDEKTGEWAVEAVTPNSDKLNIIFTDAHEITVAGVPLTGATSVDATARVFGLHEITIDPNILGQLAARALHNFFVPEGIDNNDQAAAWLKDCKAGAPAERTVEVYTTTGGMNPEELQLVMNCGQKDLPEGSVSITGVEFVVGKWFKRAEGNNGGVYSAEPEMPWLDVVANNSGIISGMMVDISTGVMKVYVGLPFDTDLEHAQAVTAAITEVSLDYLNYYPKGLSLRMSNAQWNRAKGWYGAVRVK